MPYWKGKAKALPRGDDGGTTAGVVIPLTVVGSGVYDVAYTVPVTIGRNAKQFSLQVDTGSSDLWVASSSCSSASCSQTGGNSYDPSSATPTDSQFNISYLSGKVLGPIVWDSVTVGGYSIENQALAAATSVTDEPLTPDFTGILGLALPLNSIIAENIPPVINNSPDGAAWASNLFSITPVENAPAARFISLSLSRPGSDRIPSLLGIGKHPPEVVSDPNNIRFSTVVSNPAGILFWKAGVRAITVYVDGQPRRVEIGRSNTGAVFPSAVIDSGVPFIFTTSKVANAIYGAIDIHPAQDGNYYVPCRTPLNLSITLDDRPEISLHPLDLTAEPPKDNNAEFCVGLIQAADTQLIHPATGIGDMILGVPFMRNVYTVMAYTVPNDDGSFSPVNTSAGGMQPIRPRLGMMSLTDPTSALDEFNKVRVLNQPISSNGGSGHASPVHSHTEGKKLSVGIIVLIALLSFFALCCALFLMRWLFYQRRYKKDRERDRQEGLTDDKRALAYQLSARGSNEFTGMPSEDTLRAMRYEAYVKKERTMSYSSSSSRHRNSDHPEEFGAHGVWNDETLVAGARASPSTKSLPSSRHSRSASSPERSRHQRTPSEMPDAHQRTTSIATPLLESGHMEHHDDHDEYRHPHQSKD